MKRTGTRLLLGDSFFLLPVAEPEERDFWEFFFPWAAAFSACVLVFFAALNPPYAIRYRTNVF